MKRKILLLSAVCFSAVAAQAQIKAYAITGTQKGSSNWTEVRMVDVSTGDELKTIYQNNQDVEKLNARTGKAIAKKDPTAVVTTGARTISTTGAGQLTQVTVNGAPQPQTVTIIRNDGGDIKTVIVRKIAPAQTIRVNSDAPFATTSAALAYDKKHDRLYYTPMGINELRYIDMKTNTTKVYYFENEAFGALAGRGDVPNQITRMVFGADGKGYALTNNADHLIQFEADKKPEIKDLGALVDDPANGIYTVHSAGNYGGDMVADAKNNLYLITANSKVYKIDIKTMVATYKGKIKGLPAGFTTNGAVVEKDGEGSVVVCSSTSTNGYYRFDLETLQSEKASSGESVYNASDLANGNLAYTKKKKDDEPVKEEQPTKQEPTKNEPTKAEPQAEPAVVPPAKTENSTPANAEKGSTKVPTLTEGTISVYPNPVTTGVTRVSFKDYVAGKYQVQVMDISGKMLSTQTVNINNKLQTEEVRLPQYIAKGSYMIKVVNEESKIVSVNPIIVQ